MRNILKHLTTFEFYPLVVLPFSVLLGTVVFIVLTLIK